MAETNGRGENEKTNKTSSPTGDTPANGGEEATKVHEEGLPPKQTPLSAQIAISEDGQFFLFQVPTKPGVFFVSGWIHEIALPYIRNWYREKAMAKMQKEGIIKPNQQGFRGFNPFKRRH